MLNHRKSNFVKSIWFLTWLTTSWAIPAFAEIKQFCETLEVIETASRRSCFLRERKGMCCKLNSNLYSSQDNKQICINVLTYLPDGDPCNISEKHQTPLLAILNGSQGPVGRADQPESLSFGRDECEAHGEFNIKTIDLAERLCNAFYKDAPKKTDSNQTFSPSEIGRAKEKIQQTCINAMNNCVILSEIGRTTGKTAEQNFSNFQDSWLGSHSKKPDQKVIVDILPRDSKCRLITDKYIEDLRIPTVTRDVMIKHCLCNAKNYFSAVPFTNGHQKINTVVPELRQCPQDTPAPASRPANNHKDNSGMNDE